MLKKSVIEEASGAPGHDIAAGEQGTVSALKLAIPGILLVLVCLIPFLNKAYTIDDPYFLLEARQILKTPLQPMSFGMCWHDNGTCIEHVGNWGPGTTQALMGYFLAPVLL